MDRPARRTLDRLRRKARFLQIVVPAIRRLVRLRMPRPVAGSPSLNTFERSVYSQNGEDGILEEIFRRIGTTNRFAVEFGVEDGFECMAANLIRRFAWSALLIEGSEKYFKRLARNYRSFSAVRTVFAFITKASIVDIFEREGVPVEFDLLSIDLDGNDFWIWKELDAYRPRVVVIEYNAIYPPPFTWVMAYNAEHTWNRTSYYGASLSALNELARAKGYDLVGTDSKGLNAFFVRKDVVAASALPTLTAEEAYHPLSFGLFGGRHPYASGPSDVGTS